MNSRIYQYLAVNHYIRYLRKDEDGRPYIDRVAALAPEIDCVSLQVANSPINPATKDNVLHNSTDLRGVLFIGDTYKGDPIILDWYDENRFMCFSLDELKSYPVDIRNLDLSLLTPRNVAPDAYLVNLINTKNKWKDCYVKYYNPANKSEICYDKVAKVLSSERCVTLHHKDLITCYHILAMAPRLTSVLRPNDTYDNKRVTSIYWDVGQRIYRIVLEDETHIDEEMANPCLIRDQWDTIPLPKIVGDAE